MLYFWFKFIYPNLSFIESGNPSIATKKISQNLVDGHISYVYENICVEEMWNINDGQKWPFYFDKIGRWWNNNSEIDIVALDNEGKNIIFGECKYWESKVGLDVLMKLEEKAKEVDWKKDIRKNWFVLFAINGFTDELKNAVKSRINVLVLE